MSVAPVAASPDLGASPPLPLSDIPPTGVPPSGAVPDVPPLPGAVALAFWATQLEAAFLAAEAGSVLTLRMMSFSGLRPMVPGEHLRMVVEKPPAFLAAALAAWIATVSGRRADEVLAAAIRPLRAEASANVLRLSR
jgi:hypothetical protein